MPGHLATMTLVAWYVLVRPNTLQQRIAGRQQVITRSVGDGTAIVRLVEDRKVHAARDALCRVPRNVRGYRQDNGNKGPESKDLEGIPVRRGSAPSSSWSLTHLE